MGKRLFIAAVVFGLVSYAIAFYATPLTSICDDTGKPLTRAAVVWQLFWLPDQYLFPNWFGSPTSFTILDRVPVMLAAGAMVGWASLLGWLLCRAFRLESWLTRLEMFVFSAAVGLSLVSTWVLLLGLLGVMNAGAMFWAPALLTVAGGGYVFLRERGQHAVASESWSPRWLWLAVPFAAVIVLAAMVPRLDFDVREYHLQAPKEFFEQGQITFLPHNVYANMAMGTEMLSLLAMVLTGKWWLGALVGKTVIAMFAPLTALGLVAVGRRLFSPLAGVVAALVYLSTPWIVSIASGGFVEGASACYLLLAVYALLLARNGGGIRETGFVSEHIGPHPSPLPKGEGTYADSRLTKGEGTYADSCLRKGEGTFKGSPLLEEHGTGGARFALLSGFLAGSAVATKYPAALFVLLPLAIWISWGGRAAWKQGMVFVLAATAACGLWFGKNWVLTGNPTYPLLYSVFDGRSWNAEKERQWNRVHRPHDFSLATLGKDVGRVALTSEWISPLVVPLAALAFIGRGRRFSVRWRLLAYAGFVIATWWLFTHRIDRFWIPVLPILALLAGLGACWSEERWWRRTLAAILMVGLAANFVVASSGQGNAWFVSLARLRKDPAWIDPWHQYFNAEIGQGRLLTVGDAAVFDLTIPVLYNTCFDDCIFEQLAKDKTPQEVRAAFRSRDIAYVYVNWSEIDRYRHTYGFSEFVQPAVFERLVAEGILEPLPRIEGSSGAGYRVKR